MIFWELGYRPNDYEPSNTGPYRLITVILGAPRFRHDLAADLVLRSLIVKHHWCITKQLELIKAAKSFIQGISL